MKVYLEISSWIGISIGAIHFYGKMKCSDGDEFKSIEMLHPLTISQARELNKNEKYRLYDAGDMYYGYDSKNEIRKQAIETYKDLFPGATVLIEGHIAYADPQPILDGELL